MAITTFWPVVSLRLRTRSIERSANRYGLHS